MAQGARLILIENAAIFVRLGTLHRTSPETDAAMRIRLVPFALVALVALRP